MSIKILGLGGAGYQIASYLKSQNINYPVVLINADEEIFRQPLEGVEKILFAKDVFKGKGAGGDFKLVYEIAKKDEKLKHLVDNNDVFIILFGFGQGTGMVLMST